MFALYYAHLYYRNDRESGTEGSAKGLDFSEEKQPDYWGFFYFSLIIGMTC